MMKFRKRVKVFPGFHLNFSASGISSTVGFKGSGFNISRQRMAPDVSPGRTEDPQIRDKPKNTTRSFRGAVEEIKSASLSELDSAGLSELKELLKEAYNDRLELSKEIMSTRNSLSLSEIIYTASRLLIIGFFVNYFKESRDAKKEYLLDLEQQLENTHVNVDLQFDETFQKRYYAVTESYKQLMSAKTIWDITSTAQQDRVASRSAASHVINRVPVIFKMDSIRIIRSSYQALHFENKNGGDLYIYPGFVVMTSNMKTFAMLELKELDIILSQQNFVEEEKVPADASVIGKTWAKVNKNGTPDKRFKDNYEIPIVCYGKIEVRSAAGLNEVYSVSNYDAAEQFVTAINNYKQLLKNG